MAEIVEGCAHSHPQYHYQLRQSIIFVNDKFKWTESAAQKRVIEIREICRFGLVRSK